MIPAAEISLEWTGQSGRRPDTQTRLPGQMVDAFLDGAHGRSISHTVYRTQRDTRSTNTKVPRYTKVVESRFRTQCEDGRGLLRGPSNFWKPLVLLVGQSTGGLALVLLRKV